IGPTALGRLGRGVTFNLVHEALTKDAQRHAALGIVRSARVDAERPLGVVVADDHDVRNLLELGLSNPSTERFTGFIHADANALLSKERRHVVGVVVVIVTYAEYAHLLGAEPRRQVPGVVLDENREKPLDRSKERAVNHDRALASVIRRYVRGIKVLGLL